MKISIQCGQCGKQYQVKPELAGKKVKCQGCGTPISIPAAGGEREPKKPAAAKSAAPGAKKAPANKAAPGASAKAPPGKAVAAPPAGKKGAVPAAAKPAAVPPPQHSILDEAMAGAAKLPTAGEMYCPKCKAIIPANSVICITCGTNLQSGRATNVASEANKKKRKPGERPGIGVLVALVSIFYGLAGAVFFTWCIVLSGIILFKVGLPNAENGESATAMFGLPVHILLSTAGALMFVSGIGILRYTKGATLNAGLGAKLYVVTLLALMAISVGNAIYKNTDYAKEAAAKAAIESSSKKAKPLPELGQAKALTASELMGHVKMEALATLVGLFTCLIVPPAFVWGWSATQGRHWDWELPDPQMKIKLKPTAKVGGPQPEPEKK